MEKCPLRTIRTAYGLRASIMYDEKRFTTPHGKVFHALELQQLRRVAAGLDKGSKVLDVGCGTGRFVYEMLKAGHSVWGVDPSPYMLEVAGKKCADFSRVHFTLAEGAFLPYPGESFDFVYSVRTLNQTESRDYALRMIREMIRVTKPGGLALIEFCNRWRPRFRRSSAVRLSVGDVRQILQTYSHARLVGLGGVLFLSETVMNRFPARWLSIFTAVDRSASRLLPQFASRCYVTIHRT